MVYISFQLDCADGMELIASNASNSLHGGWGIHNTPLTSQLLEGKACEGC